LVAVLAVVIAVISLGANFYVLFAANYQVEQSKTQVAAQVAALQSSVSNLEATVGTLRSQFTQLQQSQGAEAQAVAAAQASLLNITRQLSIVSTELNDNVSNYIGFRNQVNFQIQNITNAMSALSKRLNAIVPQVPLSSVTVVGDTYNAANYTFTIDVRNNLNISVYAQLEAELYGTGGSDCSGIAGSYVSQVYSLPPGAVVATKLPLSAGVYQGCASNPVTSLSVQYMASQQVRVSPQYTFQIAPPYNHP
jgi:hypothetical protein